MIAPDIDETPLSDETHTRLARLVERHAGLVLGPEKRHLLRARLLPRVRELDTDFAQYADRLRDHPVELQTCIELLCTHETAFFREPHHFEILAREVYPRWREEAASGTRPRVVRAWSAGCATGEEPFSLAMQLLHHFPASEGWTVDVLATDLSTRALEAARRATWRMERATAIPERWLHRYMLRGTGPSDGLFRAGRELQRVVRCAPYNLVVPEGAPGAMDLLFCRNVLIYFSRSVQRDVLERLIDRVAPGGALLLGHAESLAGITDRLRSIGPTVYQQPRGAE